MEEAGPALPGKGLTSDGASTKSVCFQGLRLTRAWRPACTLARPDCRPLRTSEGQGPRLPPSRKDLTHGCSVWALPSASPPISTSPESKDPSPRNQLSCLRSSSLFTTPEGGDSKRFSKTVQASPSPGGPTGPLNSPLPRVVRLRPARWGQNRWGAMGQGSLRPSRSHQQFLLLVQTRVPAGRAERGGASRSWASLVGSGSTWGARGHPGMLREAGPRGVGLE